MKNILLLNGPNLNMLGKREPGTYGPETLEAIVMRCRSRAEALGLTLDARQSNHEGEMIDWLHTAYGQVQGVIVNPGGLTHTSVSLRDALAMLGVPIIEVHLSNIHTREAFRHVSLISGIAVGCIVGLGAKGYEYAIDALAERLSAS